MAQYTIEDIEILRHKSGISYEEAVNLLEYHNGSLARALVDLEKNGRIRESRGGAYGAPKVERAIALGPATLAYMALQGDRSTDQLVAIPVDWQRQPVRIITLDQAA